MNEWGAFSREVTVCIGKNVGPYSLKTVFLEGGITVFTMGWIADDGHLNMAVAAIKACAAPGNEMAEVVAQQLLSQKSSA